MEEKENLLSSVDKAHNVENKAHIGHIPSPSHHALHFPPLLRSHAFLLRFERLLLRPLL
jgi:hypothetical protein